MNRCTEIGLKECKPCISGENLCLFRWYCIQLNNAHNNKDASKDFIDLCNFVKRGFPREMIYFAEAVKLYPNFEKLLVLC